MFNERPLSLISVANIGIKKKISFKKSVVSQLFKTYSGLKVPMLALFVYCFFLNKHARPGKG